MARYDVGLICKECGMEQESWGTHQGVTKNGAVYCCEGCAQHTACTCLKQEQTKEL